jgi:hypothetical protein
MKRFETGEGQHGTPLNYAILWHRVEEAEWLLANGADPDLNVNDKLSARDRVKQKRPEAQAPFLELLARYDEAQSA